MQKSIRNRDTKSVYEQIAPLCYSIQTMLYDKHSLIAYFTLDRYLILVVLQLMFLDCYLILMVSQLMLFDRYLILVVSQLMLSTTGHPVF